MQIQIESITAADFSDPALSVYTETSESVLFHKYEPAPGIFITESPNVISRALRAGYRPLSFLIEEGQMEKCGPLLNALKSIPGDEAVPVRTACSRDMRRITGYPMTRGVLCAMRRRPLPDPASLVRDAKRIAILEDIENPTNIGAIFRSAAAMFIDAVILSPGCADPLYRRAARVSMGTVFQIPWTFAGRVLKDDAGRVLYSPGHWPDEIIPVLQESGFCMIALALTQDTIPIDSPALKEKDRIAVILGNESTGIRPETLHLCDFTVKIPMAHDVDSLNVAAASAVAFWELSRRS